MEKIMFSRPLPEVACIIGNLFDGMEPPCMEEQPEKQDEWLTLRYSEDFAAKYKMPRLQHQRIGAALAQTELRLKGRTKTGGYAELRVCHDRCEFYGDPEELKAILDGRCPERRCERG